ncbi:MAG: restriction endonuclease subunit S domain-containing protein [Bacillota bacterium]
MTASKNVKLGEIANILNGVPDTKQFELVNNASAITYNFIQPNHLGIFNDIQSTSEIKRQTPVDDSYFIRKNDILLKRLNPDTATLIGEDILNTTFSSNLFVIRVFKNYFQAYIACLLENQGMTWLNSNIVGSVSAIKSISTKALAELDIPAIDYEKQKAIGQMWLLYKKRKQLLGDLIAEDQRLMAAVINSITVSAKEEE